MDKKLLAYIDVLVSEYVSKLELPRGKKGLRGSPGKGFDFEEHQEKIESIIKENLVPGKDFVFSEHKEEIENIIKRNLPKILR